MTVTDRTVLYDIKSEAEDRLKFTRDGKEIFLALFILKSTVKVSDKVETACASLEWDGKPVIMVNPEFWTTIEGSQNRFDLLTHEAYHLLLKHFSRISKPATHSDATIQNVAMDMAINQMIVGLSKHDSLLGSVPPVNYYTFGKFLPKGVRFEALQEAEYYYALLKKHSKQIKISLEDLKKLMEQNKSKKGKDGKEGKEGQDKNQQPKDSEGGIGTGDGITVYDVFVENHDPHRQANSGTKNGEKQEEGKSKGGKTGKTDSEVLEGHTEGCQKIAEELFDDFVKRTMNKAGVGAKDLGLDITDKNKVNWKQILQMFVSQALTHELRRYRNRKNKRYGWVAPKRGHKKNIQIDVLVDTSGSMGGTIEVIFSELVKLSQEVADFHVYTVDTKLEYAGKVTTASDIANMKIRKYGGTDFTEALVELQDRKEKRPVIFLTDTWGDFPENPVNYDLLILSVEPEEHIYNKMPEWARKRCFDMSDLFREEKKKS